MFTPALPGKARAALIVLGIFLGLSVISIFQLLSIRSDLSRSLRSSVDLIVLITLGVMALFVVGGILVATKRSAAPLVVTASVSLGLSMFTLRTGLTVSYLITVGMLVAMICLLASAEVKGYFAARRFDRANAAVPSYSRV